MIIDGRKIQKKRIEEIKSRDFLKSKVAVFWVGEDSDTGRFLKQKAKVAKALGIEFELHKFPTNVSQDELQEAVRRASFDITVGGIVVQLKLPENLDTAQILSEIGYAKDIDCLGPECEKSFYENPMGAEVAPPSVGAVKAIIKEVCHCESDEAISNLIKSKKIVLLGYGGLIGRPISAWLEAQEIKFELFRSNSVTDPRIMKERDLALKSADLIVAGVGNNRLKITGDMIKPGCLVVDFGPDVDWESIDKAGGIVTPTPGGTGPILVAELFRNYAILNAREKFDKPNDVYIRKTP